MSSNAYRNFYESGAYRRLVRAYHGREINAETIQQEQQVYAEELARFLFPSIEAHETLLDVGGSTGVVARHLADVFGLTATVLDPSPAELVHAHGLSTLRGQVEDMDFAGRTWDIITLCQTVDHLLDIAGTLRKLKCCLSEGGLLFVDIVDYDVTREIKIDPPFNLTEATMAEYLKRAGFREVARERAPAARDLDRFDGRRCHEWVMDRFRAPRVTDAFLALYERVLNGGTLNPAVRKLVGEVPGLRPWED